MSKLLLVPLVLISSAAYYGLAVWGIGGFDAYFSHPALVALLVAFIGLVLAGTMTTANVSSGVREDRGNRWVLWAFGIIGIADGFLPAYSDRLDFLTVDGEAMRWFGAVVCILGGVLRIAPVFVLGRRFSGLVAIQKDHTLVTDGLYGLVRNPSYTGVVVMTLGWGLAFRSLVGVALALMFVPVLIGRINAEEALLSSEFGAEYEAYRARTWRLVPWIY